MVQPDDVKRYIEQGLACEQVEVDGYAAFAATG